MAAEFIAGLGIFKTLLDTAKGLKDINDAATRNAVAIELHEKILAAHEAHAVLLERVGTLEKEVTRFETWEAEKQRYELRKLPPGVVVYAIKKEAMRDSEPEHCLCANCFEQGKKGHLQSRGINHGIERLRCDLCNSELATGTFQPPRVRSSYNPRG